MLRLLDNILVGFFAVVGALAFAILIGQAVHFVRVGRHEPPWVAALRAKLREERTRRGES